MKGRRHRVLHVITTIDAGGAENHLLELSGATTAMGHAVEVAYLRGSRAWEGAYARAGVRAWRLGDGRRPGPAALARLAAWVRSGGFSVVHAHLVEGEVLAALARRLVGRPPLVVTKHNDDPFWRRPAMRAMGRVVARATAQWIAISEHVRRSFVALGVPAERITTVRYGLAADSGTRLGQREARARLGLPAEGEVIGAVGRLVAQKGHIELVRALAWLGDRFPKARVVLIGDGELREAIAGEARRLGVAERVDSLGWRRDAAACMPAFDVFAQPSHWEGFGLVLLEAMAAGVPIVASRASAIPEVVEEGVTGLLVPPGDADALAGALATVLADPERARAMGAAGRARLEARFGVERMARETVAVYDRAVAGQ